MTEERKRRAQLELDRNYESDEDDVSYNGEEASGSEDVEAAGEEVTAKKRKEVQAESIIRTRAGASV